MIAAALTIQLNFSPHVRLVKDRPIHWCCMNYQHFYQSPTFNYSHAMRLLGKSLGFTSIDYTRSILLTLVLLKSNYHHPHKNKNVPATAPKDRCSTLQRDRSKLIRLLNTALSRAISTSISETSPVRFVITGIAMHFNTDNSIVASLTST